MLQKLFRRAVENRPADAFLAADFGNEPMVQQRRHRTVALHAANLLDLHARHRLTIGHYRQRFQRGLRQRLLAHGLKHLFDQVHVLRAGAQLQAVVKAHQPHAAVLVVPQGKPLQHRLEFRRRNAQHLDQGLNGDRLARCKQHRLNRRNLFRQRHLPPSPFPARS